MIIEAHLSTLATQESIAHIFVYLPCIAQVVIRFLVYIVLPMTIVDVWAVKVRYH